MYPLVLPKCHFILLYSDNYMELSIIPPQEESLLLFYISTIIVWLS